MHPIVARIHPSYRTAFVAWFFARSLSWMAYATSGAGALPLLWAPSYGEGAPLWALWVRGCRSLETYTIFGETGAGTAAMVVGGELALLVAAAALYRYARREELPQTAERATWFWCLSPVMALTIPVSAWNFGLSFLVLALAALRFQRFFAATAAIALAIGFRIEAVLVWPGFVWLAYRSYRPGKDSGTGPWMAAFGPLAAFTAVIGGVMMAAGRFGMSMRALQPGLSWRSELVWDGIGAEAPLLIAGALVAAAILTLVRAAARDSGMALVTAAPVLLWPLLHVPLLRASGAFLMAIPAFVACARELDDRSIERAAMVASVGGLVLLCV